MNDADPLTHTRVRQSVAAAITVAAEREVAEGSTR